MVVRSSTESTRSPPGRVTFPPRGGFIIIMKVGARQPGETDCVTIPFVSSTVETFLFRLRRAGGGRGPTSRREIKNRGRHLVYFPRKRLGVYFVHSDVEEGEEEEKVVE